MHIHKEGYKPIAIATILFAGLNLLSFYYISGRVQWLSWLIFLASFILLLFIVSFFRIPKRVLTMSGDKVVAPADGKVVVIEEMFDEEYFKEKRLQISIFMSPLNVHVNRNPVSGLIRYMKYHPGKYLVAWHPKSSTEKERTTLVIGNDRGDILMRQIAGALARRICFYVKEGDLVSQNEEFGFIRFGSRVDIYLPIGTAVDVKIGDVVKGGVTLLAHY